MLSAEEIVDLHGQRTRIWHQQVEASLPDESGSEAAGSFPAPSAASEWLSLIERQHRANFDLWHIEDEARTPIATDAELAAVKRRIDQTNQLRNDIAEEVDSFLLAWLEPRGFVNPEAPLNSESPGLIIDRLSILALKIYHTRGEAERADAPPGHGQRNLERLAILENQRSDLAACLDALWRETLAGSRRFKLYRQFKMYNDPSLNPVIYRGSGPRRER